MILKLFIKLITTKMIMNIVMNTFHKKNEELEIKGSRYVISDKTFYYDDGILRITLMRLGR